MSDHEGCSYWCSTCDWAHQPPMLAAHWRGYTRKVGMRKPGTLAWARAQLNDPHLTTDEWDEFIEYQSAHLTPAQVDAFAPWFADTPTQRVDRVLDQMHSESAGLSFTEQEADRCAELGRQQQIQDSINRTVERIEVHRATGGYPVPVLGYADDLPTPTIRETVQGMHDAITGKRDDADRCGACAVCYPDWRGMYLCVTCGNKRCPHATDCRNACTGSNEPGQVGSMHARLGFELPEEPTPTIRETIQGIRDAITGARPCCHSTGPNHHPACQEKP